MMKVILCLLVWAAPGILHAETTYIISGFDDVLRQAENTGLLKAAIKLFEDDKTFSGMSTLYYVISRQEENPHFSLVSGISVWFHNRVERLLTAGKYPSHQLFLRNWLTERDLEEFKLEAISTILKKHLERKFIIIFDNSDASLALAERISAKFPDRILAIYLHQIVEKKFQVRQNHITRRLISRLRNIVLEECKYQI